MSSKNDKYQDPQSEDTSQNPESEDRSVSRRKFLGYVGALALGTAASSLPIPPALASAITSEQEERDRIFKVTKSSPMFGQALAELKNRGHGFDLTKMSIERKFKDSGFYVVTLRSDHNAEPHSKAEILTRIDLKSQQADQLQFLHGRSDKNALTVSGTILSPTGKRVDSEQVFVREPKPTPYSQAPDGGCTPYYWQECCCWSFVGCSQVGCCRNTSNQCVSGLCIQVYEVGQCRDCTRQIDCSTSCDPYHDAGRYRTYCNVCCE